MKQIFSYILPALLIGIYLTGIVILNLQTQKVEVEEQINKEKFKGELFRTFNSIEEIKSFITNYRTQLRIHDVLPFVESTLDFASRQDHFTGYLLSQSDSTPSYYSRTNIQVEGVDEPDAVKTDGKYIYISYKERILIIKAYPAAEAKIISEIKLNFDKKSNSSLYYQTLLYVYQDKLIVILSPQYMSMLDIPPHEYPTLYTIILIYDIKERSNPNLEWNVTIEGKYVASRMIKENVYIVTGNSIYGNEVKLPVIFNDNNEIKVEPNDVYYTPYIDTAFQISLLVHLNVINKMIKYKGFLLGTTNTVYVSLNNIYITQYEFSSFWLRENINPNKERDYTIIHRLNIEDGIKYEAVGKVPGFVLNQFSMDEYDGYFRIATTSLIVETKLFSSREIVIPINNVYILNMNLEIVGKIEGIEKGERIYAARFVKDKCYLVTFRVMDPLSVIDLSNVRKPKILGYLKIPGFSTYLHPINETHIIGIGQENWVNVKISLFDVSNFNNPKEVSKIVIGNYSNIASSEVLRNHKAFLYDSKRKLFILPFLISDSKIVPTFVSPSGVAYGYEQIFYDRVIFLVFEIRDKLYIKGEIVHVDFEEITKKITERRHVYIVPELMRSLFIEDFLYTISFSYNFLYTVTFFNKLKINNIYTLEEIKEIEF